MPFLLTIAIAGIIFGHSAASRRPPRRMKPSRQSAADRPQSFMDELEGRRY